MMLEKVPYKGWKNCLRLANREIELIITTDVGPRIIRAGFTGGQNLFKNVDKEMGLVGGDEWRIYGGHRLWHAPEVKPRTYAPDNDPVEYEMNAETLLLKQKVEKITGVEKQISIKLSKSSNKVYVNHRIINRNPWSIELAPWTLSVMAPKGRAIFPQEEYRPHPDCLIPARPVVLWHFTNMSDPRWTWGGKYIQLKQNPNATTKQKCGMMNKQGWAAYLLDGEIFIKQYDYDPKVVYADYGCNTETYTDSNFLELETLGPLTRIYTDDYIDHNEIWFLAKCECGESDKEIDKKILPLIRLI